MSRICMLSTIDNPFDPFKNFSSWFMFDIEKGYNSCGRMMRIAKITSDMSQEEENAEVERAIDVIIANDITNTYKKAVKTS